jgi:hypothetical protein
MGMVSPREDPSRVYFLALVWPSHSRNPPPQRFRGGIIGRGGLASLNLQRTHHLSPPYPSMTKGGWDPTRVPPTLGWGKVGVIRNLVCYNGCDTNLLRPLPTLVDEEGVDQCRGVGTRSACRRPRPSASPPPSPSSRRRASPRPGPARRPGSCRASR